MDNHRRARQLRGVAEIIEGYRMDLLDAGALVQASKLAEAEEILRGIASFLEPKEGGR